MGGSEFHFGTCDICKKQAPLKDLVILLRKQKIKKIEGGA